MIVLSEWLGIWFLDWRLAWCFWEGWKHHFASNHLFFILIHPSTLPPPLPLYPPTPLLGWGTIIWIKVIFVSSISGFFLAVHITDVKYNISKRIRSDSFVTTALYSEIHNLILFSHIFISTSHFLCDFSWHNFSSFRATLSVYQLWTQSHPRSWCLSIKLVDSLVVVQISWKPTTEAKYEN